MQNDLNKYSSWCEYYTLSFNADKTKALIFDIKGKKVDNAKKLVLDGTAREYVEQFRYLGVVLDRKLNFRLHVSNLLQKMHL